MKSNEIEDRIRNRPCNEPSAEATARVLAHAAQRPCSRPSRPAGHRHRQPVRFAWIAAASASAAIVAWLGIWGFTANEPVPPRVAPQAPVVAENPITDAAVAMRLASTKRRLKALKEFDYTLSVPKRSGGKTRSTVWTLDQRLKRARSRASVAAARADWPDDS